MSNRLAVATGRQGFRSLALAGSLALVAGVAMPAWAGGSSATGSMSQGRADAIGVRLSSGKVLVAGGHFDGGLGQVTLSSAELFDPATGNWQPTGSLAQARYGAGAALLPDGRVLVVGGLADGSAPTSQLSTSTEIYSPTAGAWTRGPSMKSGHVHAAIGTLQDGSVLVAGGGQVATTNSGQIASVAAGLSEIYEPTTSTWRTTGPMLTPDSGMQTALLADGRVFAGCGTGAGDFEIFDPSSAGAGLWRMAATPPAALASCALSLLPDGRVLVAGGDLKSATTTAASSAAYIYDPVADSWTTTASMNAPRASAASTALPDGRVLVSGGTDATGIEYSETEVYQPATDTWAAPGSTPSLLIGRSSGENTVLLADGTVLVAGGVGLPNSPSYPIGFSEAEILHL